MKNKKGFTLIELLAVISIIALISLVAIPNIVGLSNGIRKDNMIDDAKRLISLAKTEVSKNSEIRKLSSYTFLIPDLNTSDFSIDETTGGIKDPDDGIYDLSKSYVRYENNNNVIKYCVSLVGSSRHIGDGTESGCVYEEELHSRSNVIDGKLE